MKGWKSPPFGNLHFYPFLSSMLFISQLHFNPCSPGSFKFCCCCCCGVVAIVAVVQRCASPKSNRILEDISIGLRNDKLPPKRCWSATVRWFNYLLSCQYLVLAIQVVVNHPPDMAASNRSQVLGTAATFFGGGHGWIWPAGNMPCESTINCCDNFMSAGW